LIKPGPEILLLYVLNAKARGKRPAPGAREQAGGNAVFALVAGVDLREFPLLFRQVIKPADFASPAERHVFVWKAKLFVQFVEGGGD